MRPPALFAGASLYINVADHPARMGLETRLAALQWARSYKRATRLRAPLALVSLLTPSAGLAPRCSLELVLRGFVDWRSPAYDDRHHHGETLNISESEPLGP